MVLAARPIIINGKFYGGVLNGVHRVADCLLESLDGHLGSIDSSDRPVVRLLVPRGCTVGTDFRSIKVTEVGSAGSQVWEQTTLPWHARDGVLVSLCNLGPILHPRQLTLIHDAQFWLPEDSYPFRRRWGHRLLVPLIARASRRVLTVSYASRQILEMTRIVSPGAAGVLHNGADHVLKVAADKKALKRFGLASQGYVLVFGSTKAYKNFDVVRAAFARGVDGLRLVVVGDDVDCEGLGEAVCTGGIDDATLRALYESASCFLYPSRTEGFGLPPLEAMLVGCPVVAAPAGAIPEVCQDAVVYADVDEPTEWVAAIRSLRADPQLRRNKIEAGYRRARHFTWRDAGRHLLDEAMALAAA